MKNLFIKLGILLFAAVLISACGGDDFTKNNTSVKSVETEVVKSKSNNSYSEFVGVIEGSHKAKLSTKLMGNVTFFPFEAGSKIKKGQTLAKIQSKDIEAKKQQVLANLSVAEAAHTNMKRNYDRVKSLYEIGSATEKEFEDVSLGLEMTKSQVKAAKEMKNEINDVLSYSVLRAPFDGYIVNKFVQVGDITAPGHPLMIVENFDEFNLVANVSAEDVNSLSKGEKVKIYVDAIKGKVAGEVTEVNPGAHPASKQFSIKVKLMPEPEMKDKIKSGLFARVMVQKSEASKLFVNEKNLVRRGQLAGVYTINRNDEAVLRWLRLGKKQGSEYEVLSGLIEGEKVILTKNISEGQKIEVK